MKNSLSCFLAIIGTVIGSGFVSGKEIVVFFSRFGWLSFPCIFLSFFILFYLFKFILNKGEKALKKLQKSKISFLINIFLCLIFSSAMFAGIGNTLAFNKDFFNYFLFFLIILLCIFVFKKGIGALEKLNFVFVPLMAIIFLFAMLFSLSASLPKIESGFGGLSFFYCFLYCVMNTSNGGVMIATYSKKLSARQKTRVAFFSALALSALLLIANIVLLQNPASFESTMPALSLFDGFGKIVMIIMVFIGCLTTLLTLTFSLSSSIRGLCKNEILIFFVSIVLPLLLSLLGFDFIVENLYPLASVFGIYVLFDLFFAPNLKINFRRFNFKRH